MTETALAPEIVMRVRNMVAAYVYQRTEARSGHKWDEFKDRRKPDPKTGRERIDVPDAYREVRERICEDAFLAMRSRRSREDFVTYFIGTICAVPQYLPSNEYESFAWGLLADDTRWEDIKSLAMLTVSSLHRV